MRLFVAVDVPDELKARIESDVVEVLRPALPYAKWTRPEGRHLTLFFLGNTDDAKPVADALRPVAKRHSPFRLSFDAVGGFPSVSRPRVLWIGLAQGNDELAALSSDVADALDPLGFESEDRPFRGHLTLARFAKPRPIDLPTVRVPAVSFEATELVLFESRGGRYEALGHFEFS